MNKKDVCATQIAYVRFTEDDLADLDMMMLLDFILNGMLSTATSTKALPELRSISGMPLCG